MPKYVVAWETQIGPGITFYHGKETIEAEDEETAVETAQWKVWHRGFQDFSLSHIVVTSIWRKITNAHDD